MHTSSSRTGRPRSLREYLSRLDELGDLRRIDWEVDTAYEIGAITRHSSEVCAPAPLFTNIRGYSGYRVVGAPLAYSSSAEARMARVAIALGLAPTTPGGQIVEELAAAMRREPIAPVVVDDAPCQEKVLVGDAADLTNLPTPLLHVGDGGRYINTIGIFVVASPDRKWTNWSIARAMLIDGKRMTGIVSASQHNNVIRQMWQQRGEPMPFALVQGAEPSALFVGGMPLRDGVDEAGFLGGLFGEPMETVRCKTVDLEVPASAELVIEGYLADDESWLEGPTGEYHGYLPAVRKNRPVYHVTAITHRKEPILPVVCAGKPVDEDHTICGPGIAAVLLEELRRAGLPVVSAWVVPESACTLLAVSVSPDWAQLTGLSSTDLARRILDVCKAPDTVHAGWWISRLMVVNHDIDLTDMRDLLWAWSTRCHPVTGRVVVMDQRIPAGVVFYSEAERSAARGPVEVLDCLMPIGEDGPRSTAFSVNFPADLQRRVLARLNHEQQSGSQHHS
ncbi:UbiD family decarboxylase [Micromonospora sp. MH33]|uniref:UbiD family decarboxylase n=1 Tax=Micromonospora sp. MH33 TaxID=1945509 RepID=UPI000D14B3CC|nr:UbiD family decarboxylase [Micromonospora sp. MH33]